MTIIVAADNGDDDDAGNVVNDNDDNNDAKQRCYGTVRTKSEGVEPSNKPSPIFSPGSNHHRHHRHHNCHRHHQNPQVQIIVIIDFYFQGHPIQGGAKNSG